MNGHNERRRREKIVGLLLRPVRADDDVLAILSVGLHKEILMATCLSLSSSLIAINSDAIFSDSCKTFIYVKGCVFPLCFIR